MLVWAVLWLPLCLALSQSSEESCPLADGSCQPAKSSSSVLPTCEEDIELKDLVEKSKLLCNPRHVPENLRAPKKISGLYWLKGLPLPDVAACFSTGEWNQDTLTLKLTTWRDFYFKNDFAGRSLAGALYEASFAYLVKFKDDTLSEADITPTSSSRLWSPLTTAFGAISSFPLIEVTGVTPGTRFARPSYFGIADFKVLTNEYEAWKILDADLHPVTENIQMMMKLLPRKIGDKHIVKFSEGPCSADVKSDNRRGDQSCAGLFVELVKQPQLGLVHQELEKEIKLAHVSSKGCHAEYSLICQNGIYEIKESHLCTTGHFTGPGQGTVEGSWEVCASADFSLSLLTPVLDLTWDVEIPPHTPVEGCLRVSLPEEHPELEKVRGTMEQQKQVLIAKKKEVGGCPTFRTAGDRLARAGDFEGSGLTGVFSRQYLKLLQKELSSRAQVWAHAPPGKNQESFIDSTIHVASLSTFLPYFANRTTAFTTCAALNCGEPVPFIDGPMRFHYEEVASAQANPKQKRVFSLASTTPTEECHARSLPLFYSSGSPEHTQWRQLLDAAGFEEMHKKELTTAASLLDAAWLEKLRRAIGMQSVLPAPTELEVGRIVIPLVFEAIWGKKISASEVYQILPYLELGKMCILGKRGKHVGVVQPRALKAIKNVAIAFARDSPTAQKLYKLIQEPKFATLKHLLETDMTEETLNDKLVRDIIHASLFAGVLGTSDMTTKCVQSQFKDGNHVMMFRKDAGAYLHELMRLDGAVQQFTTALDSDQTIVLEGHKVAFPKDQAVNMVMNTANRDPSKFPDPDVFDPDRANLDEMLTWNGQLKHVMARNYSGAPRFCPGYHLSMKVAKEVCAQMTKDLNQWGGFSREHAKIEGLVKIKTPGYFGKHASVAYFDFSKDKYCLTEKYHHDTYIGCFPDEELEVVDPNGGRPKTLEEEYNMCPKMVPAMMQMLLRVLARQEEAHSTVGWMIDRLLGKKADSEDFHPDWADDFVVGLYAGINLVSMPMYSSRHANSVFVPRRKGTVEVFQVGSVVAPDVDIDNPKFVPVEWYIPQPLLDLGMVPAMTCFHGFLRQLPWDDMLDGERNTWDLVMNLSKFSHRRKEDWVMSFYKGYKSQDGVENWPSMEVNFAKMYWKQDEWDDGLEKAIAFGLIASHRLEELDPPVNFGGVPSVLICTKLFWAAGCWYHALEVRKNLAKFQARVFFEEGYPAMMKLADGTQVGRGDKDWQYWKFVWRCSLITIITLTDHLHYTHFRAGNVLATAVRKTLSPNHPLRRLLSVFTFGTIFVNLQAMHTLIGPRHVLHRSTPFVQFEDLSDAVPQHLLPLTQKHQALLKEEEWKKLPPKVRSTPYFSDGKLLFDAERKLLKEFRELYGYGAMGFCSKEDQIVGPEAQGFVSELIAENAHSHYASALHQNVTCTEFFEEILMAYIWTVTGWHRHVGTVGDYYRDPELASFSWVEGERSARPLQHMQMTTVAVFTSSLQPKIIEDYSHVFQGVHKEAQMLQILDRFRAELHRVSAEIQRRNQKRLHDPDMGFENVHADPKIVECSVAV
ncbi:5-methyl-1-naphthoate 3-hydroxylase (Azinomycin biosynthesis protein B1) [Durusdinium trenchii]|uniref:5-methyl-1-naphthoate 3-hydroxylase (Azinomycin biosynthesis protein B1) n=1 Tax=Durusdinium trenchii TaxID=1381693 RepID=A0ABP0Q5U7_9DINO